MLTLHLIPNAHLDPVWLWDWREGLTEAVTTSQTILDLMDEFEELTFARGDAVYYRHVEEFAPRIFQRIRRRIEEGRWEVVGGTHVQPDMNLPATETLLRHFEMARHYFRDRFGYAPTVAWLPDSFGHSGGLPEILAAAGMKSYAFGRPTPHERPLARPAFWWVGQGGARILAYRTPTLWYGNERGDMPQKLDTYLAQFAGGDLENVAVPYGLGNHGGGPTRRMLHDIRQWAAAHPEVKVKHSTFHEFFEALRKEAQRKGPGFLPEHAKELNFCLRGCYASVAKLKFAYRRTEALTCRAEKISTAIHAALGRRPPSFAPQWDAILFNSFHDILPGSSIERAYDEQLDWLGSALHADRRAELAAIMALAEKVDTSVAPPKEDDLPTAVPFLVFNPHPFPFRGHVEIEPSLDYRPIAKYQNRTDQVPIRVCGPNGRSLPFQRIATEHYCLIDAAWRARLLVPVDVPPLGWTVLTAGWEEGTRPPLVRGPAEAAERGTISNGFYRVEAQAGTAGLRLWREGRPLFGPEGLHLITVEDPWGSWGGMREEPEAICLSQVRHRWEISAVEILERGPERAALWVEMTGGRSRIELTVSLCRNRRAVDVVARVLWNERAARLKLVLPGFGAEGEFEVPGGIVRRGAVGEVPGGRWVRASGEQGTIGFASDALYAFDCTDGAFRATIVRASRYASDPKMEANEHPWLPAVDRGELKFRFSLSPGGSELPDLAAQLEQPPLAVTVPPTTGPWPRCGSFALLEPRSVRLLALKPAESGRGILLRIQQVANRAARVRLTWLGQKMDLGEIGPWQIKEWRLRGCRAKG